MKKKVLGLVCIALLALTFTGCESSEHKAQINTLVDILETRNVEKIYQATDEETKNTYAVEVMDERLHSFYDTLAVEKVEYKRLRKDKKASQGNILAYKAKVILTTASGDIEKDTILQFSQQGEDIHIHWTPESVFPNLTMDNTVQIEVQSGKRGTIYARDGEVLAKDDENGVRQYPQGLVTSAAVGYVRAATGAEIEGGTVKNTSIGTQVGRTGFEKAYQERLVAKSGIKVTLSDHPEDILFESQPENGEDIKTTLDLKVQKSAYDVVNGEFSAVAAVEPHTGQVLAMVDGASYDPERWTDAGMSPEEYAAMVAENRNPDNGLFADRFTPGSTQKLLTTLIGLKAGTLNTDTTYEIYGEDWAPPGGWGSYKVHRVVPINGAINLKSALIYSDNIYFARVGLDMGYDNFNNGMKNLGIGKKVPGAYPIQKSQVTDAGGVVQDHETGLADSSFGQYQVQVAPLQQTLIYASLQNGGKIMKPCYLLEETPEVWIDGTATQENIDFINQALRQSVLVSHPAADRDFGEFSGKTGTAEVGPDGSINLGWFVGSDLTNPTCTMCVMVNHVENRGGSDVNAAYFGRIMEAVYADGSYKPSGLDEKEDKE